MSWFATNYAGKRKPLEPAIAELRASQRRMACVSATLLRETRSWLASGNVKKAVEWWGASRLVQGAADGCHDTLLTKASALVRDEILARLP